MNEMLTLLALTALINYKGNNKSSNDVELIHIQKKGEHNERDIL